MSILVTRPSPAGEALVKRLTALGKTAWHTPLIDFLPGNDLPLLPATLSTLSEGDWVIATSQHAIHYAQSTLQHARISWPEHIQYFAIGKSTALQLHAVSGQHIISPPLPETSESLLQLPQLQDVQGRQVLILRGNGGRRAIAETLSQRGAHVMLCECYQRHIINYNGPQQSAYWQKLSISTLVISSGEMLQLMYELIPQQDRETWLLQCHLVVVSERLAGLARILGWRNIKVAEGADNDALLRALQ